MQHGVRDAAEAHSLKAAAAARAHHEKRRACRLVQELGPRRADAHLAHDRDLRELLLVRGQHLGEVLFHGPRAAEDCRRVREGTDREQRDPAHLRLAESEPDRRLRREGAVGPQHHGTRRVVVQPVAAHDHHGPPRVAGHLHRHRAERQPGDTAVPARAQHRHLGGGAVLAQHPRGGSAREQRSHPALAQHALRVPDPGGEDLLAAMAGQVEHGRLA